MCSCRKKRLKQTSNVVVIDKYKMRKQKQKQKQIKKKQRYIQKTRHHIAKPIFSTKVTVLCRNGEAH